LNIVSVVSAPVVLSFFLVRFFPLVVKETSPAFISNLTGLSAPSIAFKTTLSLLLGAL